MRAIVVTIAFILLQLSAGFAQAPAPKGAIPGLTQQDLQIPGEEAVYRRHGFAGEYSADKAEALSKFIAAEIEFFEAQKAAAANKDAKKLAEVVLSFLKYGRQVLRSDSINKSDAFVLARRALSTALVADVERTLNRYPEALQDPQIQGNKLPLTAAQDGSLNGLVGQILTAIATKLQQPAAGSGSAVLQDKLKTRLQRLLIPNASVVIPMSGAPTRAAIPSTHPSHFANPSLNPQKAWADYTQWLEGRMGGGYKFAEATQVLMFREVSTSATSPKIKAEDAFGNRFNVKSGDEVQMEVIANRLWLAMGGKYVDYTRNVQSGDMILVLPNDVNKIHPEASANGWDHRRALEMALLLSGYQYRLANNIQESGVVTEQMQQSWPEKVRAAFKGKNLVGQTYVRLRSANLDFKPSEGFTFGEGVALSSENAMRDPVIPTSVLFNAWIGNRDHKDTNSNAVLIEFRGSQSLPPGLTGAETVRNKSGQTRSVYLEYQSDLGNSHGSMFAAGDIRALKGQDFLTDVGGSIRLNEPMLYVPRSWNTVHAADLLSEASKIVTLMEPLLYGYKPDWQKAQYAWILSQTNWPTPFKLALINRMVERTRGILKQLESAGLSVKNAKGQTVYYVSTREFNPSFTLSPDNLDALAREVDVARGELEKFVGARLVIDGQIQSDEALAQSLWLFLEKHRYPEGLAFRRSRTTDFNGIDETVAPPKLALSPEAIPTILVSTIMPQSRENLLVIDAALRALPERQVPRYSK